MKSCNVIITGSTSGLGLGIARFMAALGYNILINGIVDGTVTAQKICADIKKLHKEIKVEFHGADVSKKDQIHNMIEHAEKTMGGADILINNAGIQHVCDVAEFPDDKWDAIMAINLSAYFHTIKHALPKMRAKNYGRIINISSTHGLVASSGKVAYIAAKHGVIGLTKAVALDNASYNITCNALCPGFMMTPLVEKQIHDTSKEHGRSFEDEKSAFVSQKHPNGRFVEIEEICSAVMLLINNQSMTGSSLVIDGGWTAT